MLRKVVRVLAWLAALVVLIALGGVYLVIRDTEPMADVRQRADALPIPDDFVLVSESYHATGGYFGGTPELERTYHAPWPGLCDSLRGIREWAGDSLEAFQWRTPIAGKNCDYGAWYPAGGLRAGLGAWIRGWNYRLHLAALEPALVQEEGPYEPAYFLVLYPKGPLVPRRIVSIPPGRAKVSVRLMGIR